MNTSTNNNEGKRKRILRAVFTPTQRPSATVIKHYLLFFDATASYQIVARSSIKKIDNEGFAIISIRNKLWKGEIILEGSLDDCEMELSRQTRLSQQENNIHEMDLDHDNDDNEVEDENNGNSDDEGEDEAGESENALMTAATHRGFTSQSSFRATASSITVDRQLSIGNDEPENEGSITDKNIRNDSRNSIKKKRPNKRKNTSNNKSKKRSRVDNEADNRFGAGTNDPAEDLSILNVLDNKFKALENQLLSIENKNNQKLLTVNKKLDHLTSSSVLNKTLLDAYRDEHNETFQSELIFGQINLLDTVASSVGDFARKTMRIVFSEHELTTHVLPPARAHLVRTSLDEKRFQLVNNAIQIKFKLDSTKYPAFYKNILRRKLSDFLIEERRREWRKMNRHAQQEQMNLNQTH